MAGGEGKERGSPRRERRFLRGGDSLGGRRRWESSRKGINKGPRWGSASVLTQLLLAVPAPAQLKARQKPSRDERGQRCCGSGGAAQCQQRGSSPRANTYRHKPTSRQPFLSDHRSPRPAPAIPTLPQWSRSTQQQEAVLAARPCFPASRRERAGLPRRPPRTARRVFNEHRGRWQRSALLSSSQALRRQLQNLLARRWQLDKLLLTLQAGPPESSADRLLTAARNRKRLPPHPRSCGSPGSRTALIRAPLQSRRAGGAALLECACPAAGSRAKAAHPHRPGTAAPPLAPGTPRWDIEEPAADVFPHYQLSVYLSGRV